MMSDLAPFVAAVIRDRVVVELKDEIEALRQENAALKLECHKRNPRRSVKVTGSNRKEMFAENEYLHAMWPNIFERRSYFCDPGGLYQSDLPKQLILKCGKLASIGIVD